MGKPRKHAELIKAWADGAEIEFYDVLQNIWHLMINPTWQEEIEYRIKPKKSKELKIEVGKYYKTRNGLKVRIYATDVSSDISLFNQIHGAVLNLNQEWVLASWSKQGKKFSDGDIRGANDIIGEWEEPRQEEKASVELKIEAGKYYKTRNGCKVKIYEIYDNNDEDFYKIHFYEIHGAVFENKAWHIESWTLKGEQLFEETTPYDIIEEWEE